MRMQFLILLFLSLRLYSAENITTVVYKKMVDPAIDFTELVQDCQMLPKVTTERYASTQHALKKLMILSSNIEKIKEMMENALHSAPCSIDEKKDLLLGLFTTSQFLSKLAYLGGRLSVGIDEYKTQQKA